jgi:hypothetical protein
VPAQRHDVGPAFVRRREEQYRAGLQVAADLRRREIALFLSFFAEAGPPDLARITY